MRAFLLFVALLAGALIAAAVLTYPAWLLVSFVSVEPVHRVMNRVAMLVALIGLVYLTRRLGLSDRSALGYGLRRAEFLRQLALGWVCGLALMAPLIALLVGLDIRAPKDALAGGVLALVGGAVLSGVVVAFIEETFFRGVLYTAVVRTSGAAAAIVAPSLLYASLHFLGGKLRVPADEVSWVHGFTVLGKLFERYTDPLAFVDSFIALFALGLLLAVVRLRTGAIAACIGLHAAGVAVIAVVRATTQVQPTAEYAYWVGAYDGVIGWAALLWFGLIALVYVRATGPHRFMRARSGSAPREI
jgi:membrane protease YdiL (CAAX protease family)